MYVPREYREEDREKLLSFMREHSFATLVSAVDSVPVATHLPFIVKFDGESVTLVTHMARGNKQWKSFGEQDVLVIFQGPNAYISPMHYDDKARVPTWNYIAVHAYGKPRATSFDEHDAVLRTMIDEFEPTYMGQYETLPEPYKTQNMKGIVCIEIAVTKLEASYKLSQDKSEADRERVSDSLAETQDPGKQELAAHMRSGLQTD